jgi:uncharacterized LabA/DUF88 family protein
MIEKQNDLQLAVLIDADNIPFANIKGMLEEIAKFGVPAIKRIYGDWTKRTVSGWKPALLEHAITPIQQYSYTRGKNATDSAMIIDAMDILHDNKVNGFCLVSSDSDFTRLAIRLRESGKLVIGIGEKKTPKPFIVSCDKFIYIEIIGSEDRIKPDQAPSVQSHPESSGFEKIDDKFIKLLKSSINDLADDQGWVFMAELGSLIIKRKPDFDPRNYGFNKLTPLIKSIREHFEIDERDSGKPRIKHIYVRIKKPGSAEPFRTKMNKRKLQ